jgi:hypothetical protein
LLSNLDTGYGIKKGSGFGGRGAVSFQLLVFSFQSSVVSLPELREDACFGLRASFCLLPSSRSLLPAPIASFFKHSDAIESTLGIAAMTKNPLKQAPNAPGSLPEKVQLQR